MKRAKDKKEHMNSRGVTAHEDIKVRTRRTRRERIKNNGYIGGRNEHNMKTMTTFYISNITSQSVETSNSKKRLGIRIRVSRKRRVISRRHKAMKSRKK